MMATAIVLSKRFVRRFWMKISLVIVLTVKPQGHRLTMKKSIKPLKKNEIIL